jgi:hypothetical protein
MRVYEGFKLKWEITMIELEDHNGKKYKVTRRLPELNVAETKIFENIEEAKSQFEAWLN